jgi:membrane dipeptidase
MRSGVSCSPMFDFGLSAAQERRAAQLHRESIVFDLLSQGPGGTLFAHYPPQLQADFAAGLAAAGSSTFARYAYATEWPYEPSRCGLLEQWFRSSGLTCGTYGVEVRETAPPAAESHLPWLRHVTTAAQIRQAKRDGVVALYAHCQPLAPPPRDLRAFDAAYERGLRSFMLTYNEMSPIGVGCTERVDAGLSRFGIDVVRHCNDIGMIVDVSHCGHLTTLDACRFSKQPVTANHTAARGVYAHARGKSDEALRAIADTGGVIGVVAAPPFLTNHPAPTIEHMLDHIDYIAALVGWQHVAVGTDWPLTAPDAVLTELSEALKGFGFREEDQVDLTRRLAGFEDCRDLPNITRGLVRRGYTDEQISGILGENALHVFEAVCGA